MDNLIEILLKNDIVYYNNFKTINQNKIVYSIAGHLVKRYANFYFYPSPLNQVNNIKY